MKKNNLKSTALLTLAFLLISAFNIFGQENVSPLEFIGTADGNPDSQSVSLQIPATARVEVSNEQLLTAELRETGEGTSDLIVSVNTQGLEASEDGTLYEGKVTVTDSVSFIIPIQISIFPFKAPIECWKRKWKAVATVHGTVDNFIGIEATTPSPYLLTLPLLRQYDQLGTNKQVFGDSFNLGGCRVCGAWIQVRARREGEIFDNDTLSFGVSDAALPYNPVTIAPSFAPMWTGQPSPFTFFRVIQGSTLNPQMTSKTSPRIDITSQDDTAIDYSRVTLFYY